MKLGSTGLDVSAICLGCMSYGDADAGHPAVVTRRGRRPSVLPARGRGRHQLLRHRQRLLGRQQRRDHWTGAGRLRQPRRDRRGHQGARPDAPRAERCRPVAQGDPGRDRQQPAPAQHGLRRPLPDPPLRPDDADRRDDGGAARRREGRQGPLHRRVEHVGVAVLEGAVHRVRERLDPVRLDAEPLQPALPRRRARDAAAVRTTSGVGVIPWSPLARGRLTRDWDEVSARSETDAVLKRLYVDSDRDIVEQVAAVAGRRGVSRAKVALAWVWPSRPSPRRSSAPPSCSTSTTRSPRSTSTLTADEISAARGALHRRTRCRASPSPALAR